MSYTRQELLALRLRAATSLRRLTRREMYSRLQLIRRLEPVIDDAFTRTLRRAWRDQEHDSPHGHPWHVSFHASQFPGDDPMACARQALYRMMDLPSDGPPTRWLMNTANSGKAIEIDIVKALHGAGILITAPPDADVQTGFEMPELMFTGSVDSGIAIKNTPVPIEIKTKHEKVIAKMKLGMKGPDEEHVKQLKTQMGFIRAAQEAGDIWPDMNLCRGGYIYYQSRDSEFLVDGSVAVVQTAEFFVEYDAKFFETGIEVLRQWRAYWDEEVLPSLNPFKKDGISRGRHPQGWRWSYLPCSYCSYKKVCKEDHVQAIDSLEDSVGIEYAKSVRPDYSYEEARKRVRDRWKKNPAQAA